MTPSRLSRIVATVAFMTLAHAFSSHQSFYISRSFSFKAANGDDSSHSSSDEVHLPPATIPPHLSQLYSLSPSELRAKVLEGMDEAMHLRKSGAEMSSDASGGEADGSSTAARDFVKGVTPEDPDGLFELHGALRSMDQLKPKSQGNGDQDSDQVKNGPGDDDEEDLWGAEVALFRARAAEAQAIREASGLAEAAKACKAAETTPLEANAARFFVGYSNEELSGLWSVHSGVVRPAEAERAPPKVEGRDTGEPREGSL